MALTSAYTTKTNRRLQSLYDFYTARQCKCPWLLAIVCLCDSLRGCAFIAGIMLQPSCAGDGVEEGLCSRISVRRNF